MNTRIDSSLTPSMARQGHVPSEFVPLDQVARTRENPPRHSVRTPGPGIHWPPLRAAAAPTGIGANTLPDLPPLSSQEARKLFASLVPNNGAQRAEAKEEAKKKARNKRLDILKFVTSPIWVPIWFMLQSPG